MSTDKLRKTAEHWFFEGFKHDVTPHVMGCLPDDVEVEKESCLQAGVPESEVNTVIDTAWQTARQRYSKRRSR